MLQPFISHNFNGTVWRLQIDGEMDIMGIEVRNTNDKQTSFTSISLLTGTVYFDSFTLPERWLTGIEALYKGVMLLHYYKHETSPEHSAIIAVDATAPKEVWSNYSLAFDHLTVNGPAVYNTALQPKKLFVADVATGKTISTYDANLDKPFENFIVIPDMVPAEQVLTDVLPEEPYGNMVHFLNHNSYRIVSLHTLKNGALQQHLYIMNGGNIVYHDLLNQGIQKLQPEAFVLHKSALIYIKNRTEIKVLKL
ncbi:DUF4905 domain-containing protein [Mucilaginibacter sp. 14171R-50]|uniref:DUF4905 domain-containing protein n=1 Tax=Mucilaginibacter sp. 14171R-50 TaxID=2703789 RepID=UPI00138DBDF4|nr:DUF4905 domain-containing protein [Mucilaginibacter sp. 14171R-50]QHS57465.1 DUF4905 domain-containing protein [Mucilaginibacter sp. 14171R-50]